MSIWALISRTYRGKKYKHIVFYKKKNPFHQVELEKIKILDLCSLNRPQCRRKNCNLNYLHFCIIKFIFFIKKNGSILFSSKCARNMSSYGLKCLGKIMAYWISFFLSLCDWSVPYCASLDTWNWIVAG